VIHLISKLFEHLEVPHWNCLSNLGAKMNHFVLHFFILSYHSLDSHHVIYSYFRDWNDLLEIVKRNKLIPLVADVQGISSQEFIHAYRSGNYSHDNDEKKKCAENSSTFSSGIGNENGLLLILSSESQGISKGFPFNSRFQHITVPMEMYPPRIITSLNVAIAGGILMHELRQISVSELSKDSKIIENANTRKTENNRKDKVFLGGNDSNNNKEQEEKVT